MVPKWLTWIGLTKKLYDPGDDRDHLTDREFQIGWLIATRGLTNEELAAELGVSYKTIRHHVNNAVRVTKCQDRTQFALWIIRQTGIYDDC